MRLQTLRTAFLAVTILTLLTVGLAHASIARGVVFDDQDGDGVRDVGEPGLAGVGVSNGRDVVLTDDEGRWRLIVDDADTIFVIKPRDRQTVVDGNGIARGYYVHRRRGSPPLRFGGVEPTGRLPESIDFPLYRHPEPDRFTALIFGDPQVTTPWEVEMLARDVLDQVAREESAPVTFWLGDIANNNLDMLPLLIDAAGELDLTHYYVAGNHDANQDAGDNRWAYETWTRVMGPAWYSLNWGPVHFIVLNDVVWQPAEGEQRARYSGGITDEQMEFIRNDLALVPRETLVVYMFHIPVTGLANRAEFLTLFEGRNHVFGMSAHTHTQQQLLLGPDAGWWSDEPHHHLINVTSCGAWWRGEVDEWGIPTTTCGDGVPNGYTVATFEGNRYSLEYVPARMPRSFQMDLFVPGPVSADEAAQHRIYANVFAGSDRSVVEMRIDGGAWLPMEKGNVPAEEDVAFYAAQFEAQLTGLRRAADAAPAHVPVRSTHLWNGPVPAGLAPGYHTLEVRTTDMYGQSCAATRIFRID